MKKLFLFLVVISALWQCALAADDVVWQKFIDGSGSGGRAVKFTPDGKHIIVGCKPNIYILRTEDGVIEKTLTGHTGEIMCLAVSPDGTKLASGSQAGTEDGRVILWDFSTGKIIYIFSDLKLIPPGPGDLSTTSGLAFSPDNKYLIATSINKEYDNFIIWKLDDFTIYKKISCYGSNQSLSLSSDGQYIATSNLKRDLQNKKLFSVNIWKIGEDLPFKTISIESEGGGLDDWIGKVEYSKDGKYLLVVCSRSVTILNTSDYSVKNVIRYATKTASFFSNSPLIAVGNIIYNIDNFKIFYTFNEFFGGSGDIDFFDRFYVNGSRGQVQLLNLNTLDIKENTDEPISLKLIVFPDPIKNELNISFNLPFPTMTKIDLFSLNGDLIRNITNQIMTEGQHQIIESINYLSSGSYLCKIQAGKISESINFIIIK